MRPARSSTRRCLEIAGPLMSNGAESSLTVAGPPVSRARIARRVGSARAANVALSGSESITLSGCLELLDVDPIHLQHGLHDALRSRRVGQQSAQRRRN